MTTLPRDSDNNPIPALRLKPDGAHTLLATTAVSVRNATPFDTDTRIVSVYADGPVYISFGDNSVTAGNSAHYFPTGIYYDFAIGGDKTLHTTHVAALAVDADCSVYISEKQ
jgi:hypothetical protein